MPSRSNSVTSSSPINRNLPDDPKPPSKRHLLSPQAKERLARGSLAYANGLGKTAGAMTVVPHKVGEKCGSVAGFCLGLGVEGVHSVFSSKPEDGRKKKGRNLLATVCKNTEILGGVAAGMPFLLAGGIANVALGGVAAGKWATHHLDKNSLERPAYSWRLKDPQQHQPGDKKISEPRLPIVHSRYHGEKLGFGKYHMVSR